MIELHDTIAPDRIVGAFGVAFGPSGWPIITDLAKAENAYVHHSCAPVALIAFALSSPAFARGRFPKMRLVDLIAKRPSMDGNEAIALGKLCRADVAKTMWPVSPALAFRLQLHHVIEEYNLEAFFGTGHPAMNSIDVRPRGIDWRTDQVVDAEMKAWRQSYKALRPEIQMMVATILWLYRGGPDDLWMKRLPCAWHAADAVALLRDKDMLSDWGRLVALYPGW